MKSLSLETEGGFFSFSLDEKPPEFGPVPGQCGVFIDYSVIGIFDLTKSLSLETEGGFFLFYLMKNHRSMDRFLATLGSLLITPSSGPLI